MGAKFLTAKRNNRWTVKKDRASYISSTHTNQADAWAETRRLARGAGGDAVLMGADGRVRARNAYGKDPFPSKG